MSFMGEGQGSWGVHCSRGITDLAGSSERKRKARFRLATLVEEREKKVKEAHPSTSRRRISGRLRIKSGRDGNLEGSTRPPDRQKGAAKLSRIVRVRERIGGGKTGELKSNLREQPVSVWAVQLNSEQENVFRTGYEKGVGLEITRRA